jgi:nickel-dependent lactate racemase
VRVSLAYGAGRMDVDVPDDAVVVEGGEAPALEDETECVRRSLRAPLAGPTLRDLIGPDVMVAVVFPDLTRPMPNTTVLPPLLAELESAGAGPERVELLCGTGTHRQATPSEMAALVGPDIVSRYRIHDHRADNGDHVRVGEVEGTPVLLDRRYVEADVRIVTGFVEPHFFAGWSGGPKGACPGLAATSTILEAHSPARIADARSTWLATEGNPVHEFVTAATALCPPDLCVDVTIDRHRRLTGVFTGVLPDSHRAACAFASRSVTQAVDGRFEVVLTTNGGHPLDRNLYQAVKGMAAAERVVTDGGIIVMAAACSDGLPEDGAFARILHGATSPEQLLRPDGPGELDAWQAQVLGRVLGRAEVWMYSDGLSDQSIEAGLMTPQHDVAAAVTQALALQGRGARLCVLPQGPLVVATPFETVPVHGGAGDR